MQPWLVIVAIVVGAVLIAVSMLTSAHWLFLIGAPIVAVPAILGMRAPSPS